MSRNLASHRVGLSARSSRTVRAARTTIAVVAAQCFLLAAGVAAAVASHAPANARIAAVAHRAR
jgi:hypothetical protein